jgi:hypothetical protein
MRTTKGPGDPPKFGGRVIKYKDGGRNDEWPPGGGPASRQDSLNAYNAAVELLRSLEERGYELDDITPYDDAKRKLDTHHRRARGEYNEHEISQYETFIENMKEDPESYSFDPSAVPLDLQRQFGMDHWWPKGEYPTIDEYYGIYDNTTEGNVTRVREMTTGVINPSLPTGYYDVNIDPQGMIDMTGMADYVELPYYDPLAVKPYDLLTEEEKLERREKYGPEPWEKEYKPEPETYPKANKTLTDKTPQRPRVVIPERLEPRGVRIDQTPVERDIIRRVLELPKPGRQPELIMKSSNRTSTGQEPNYYRVWDGKDKQWKMRPVEPEELDFYLRENKIVEPIVTPPISFNKGGKVVKYKTLRNKMRAIKR